MFIHEYETELTRKLDEPVTRLRLITSYEELVQISDPHGHEVPTGEHMLKKEVKETIMNYLNR
jgi:hypothetical protein